MTLFNVRLGWWLGNPGRHGARTWQRPGPLHAALPLFTEALGNTTDSYAYVNLSDGGHFDNLGLYEMILRRCRHIVAVDAGCDCDYVFEDLGNAIRKIRIDLGISIDIQIVSPKKAGAKASYYALGTIRYSPNRRLRHRRRAALHQAHALRRGAGRRRPLRGAHPDFPHEPTSDQWFSESQMESYRALGFHAVTTICRGATESAPIAEFFNDLTRRYELISSGAGQLERFPRANSEPNNKQDALGSLY